MRRLKALLIAAWALPLAFLSAIPGAAQTNPVGAFDFSASVESLAAAAESGAGLPAGRYVLLTGTVRSSSAGEGGAFSVRVELAAGQWIGTSRIVLRTVAVDFSGDSYRALVDRDSPSFLRPGSTVLVVARVAGVGTGAEGGRMALLEGVHVRRLDSL